MVRWGGAPSGQTGVTGKKECISVKLPAKSTGTFVDSVAMQRGTACEAFRVVAMDGVATMQAMDPSGTKQSKDAHQSRNTLMLSHGTARSYWLTLDPNRPDAAVPTADIPLQWSSGTPATLRGLNANYRGFGSGPLEFLVADANARRMKNGVVCHSCTSELPAGSFRKFHDGLYIASPELCFLQMARSLTLSQLVELGINLCGKYYIDPATNKVEPRAPVATAATLKRYLERVDSRTGGVAKAKRALQWVVDDSASPKETQMEMLFGLPLRYGGYGFGNAVMNYDVFPRSRKRLAEQGYYSIDACWVNKGSGAEYFGEEEHQDHVHDRRRLDAIKALGWNVVVVDKQRLYSPAAFETAAQQLAEFMKHRIRRSDSWRGRMLALRRDLGLID